MKRTREQWMNKAARHEEYVAALQDGLLSAADFAITGTTAAEALAIERRNVAYCLRMAEEA